MIDWVVGVRDTALPYSCGIAAWMECGGGASGRRGKWTGLNI